MAEEFDDAKRHSGRHRRAAVHHLSERFEESQGRRVFQQVAGSARAKDCEDLLVVVVNRQCDDGHPGKTLSQNARAFDTVHARQSDVRQDHVRRAVVNLFKRIFHGAMAADALETARAVNQHHQSFAHFAQIFDDDDADGRVGQSCGKCLLFVCDGIHDEYESDASERRPSYSEKNLLSPTY